MLHNRGAQYIALLFATCTISSEREVRPLSKCEPLNAACRSFIYKSLLRKTIKPHFTGSLFCDVFGQVIGREFQVSFGHYSSEVKI